MTLNPHHILGPDGPIAKQLGHCFESRPQQTHMIDAIRRALTTGENLVVEAATGVGKSFAYLLPVIEKIVQAQNQHMAFDSMTQDEGTCRKRAVISTHTIALQEQLIQKDIPLLQSVIDQSFSAVLVKGRGNYVSLRRLNDAVEKQNHLFAQPEAVRSVQMIYDWAKQTDDGSLATMPPLEQPSVWDKVQSDSGHCMGRRCPTYERCFYQQARRRMENADLLVVNHALFFADLALRAEGVGFLPTYSYVILDEAHTVEDVASDHFGLRLSVGQIRFLLHSLFNPRTRQGFLSSIRIKKDADCLNGAINAVQDTRQAASLFFNSLSKYHEHRGRTNGRVREPGIVENLLSRSLQDLALSLKLMRDKVDSDADRTELTGYANRCEEAATVLATLVNQSEPESVYWIEPPKANAPINPDKISLRCSPIAIGPLLKEHLFESKSHTGRHTSVVLTSATIAVRAPMSSDLSTNDLDDLSHEPSTGRQANPFTHIIERLGCHEAKTLQLGSPFDYTTQAQLRITPHLPPPNDPQYIDQLLPNILREIDRSQGGAFVLFTSYAMLTRVAQWLKPLLASRDLLLLTQGDGEPRTTLLKRFRHNSRSVLLGTDSFWQGIDVPGEALRNVIITRLPFAVPDRPLTEARLERMTHQGDNAFIQYTLPEAILKFKQGFGRLIRSRQDRGTVAVLDSRIVTKSYGRQFIEALPPVSICYETNQSSKFEACV